MVEKADTVASKPTAVEREGSSPSRRTNFFQGNPAFLWMDVLSPFGLGGVFALNWHEPETREAYEEYLREREKAE